MGREQLDFENKRGVGADVAARAARPISQVRRNEELPLGSHGHEQQSFRPPLDDLSDGEGGGLAALIRTIKFRAVEECTAIVDGHRVGGSGLGSGALLENPVLKATGKRHHAFLCLVGGQKLLAFFLVGIRELLRLEFLLFAQIRLQRRHDRLCFLVRQERLGTGQNVLYPAQQDCRVNIQSIPLHGSSDVHANGVTDFVLVGLELQDSGGLGR